jgi:hypothetical protein
MAEKRRESSFTVTDRRLFTEDGELRKDVHEEVEIPKAATPPPGPPATKETVPAGGSAAPFPTPAEQEQDVPPPPTAAEQQAQADAYQESSKQLDSRVELSGRSAKEFEMNFERFLASL